VQTRQLGNTDLKVTLLGYGAMELRHVDQAQATRLLSAALDGGINYVDTSPDYGPSEAYIGHALAARRDEFTLATKCGCNVDEHGRPQEPAHIWSRTQLERNLENSLRRLQTDHIDVWQLHGTMPDELAGGRGDETIQALQEAKQQGKVGVIGISFRNGRQGEPLYPAGYGFQAIQEFMTWGAFDMMQIVYGGLTRTNEIAIAEAASQGIGIVIRGLVKRYFDNYDRLFAQAGLDALRAEGESRDAFLIRLALSHPGVSTGIVGSKNVVHIRENIAAAERGPLPADVYAEAARRLTGVGIVPEQVEIEKGD
jgi:aryl-alcohol dehydrogenase-like predicted oxidoreductase